VYGFNLAAYSYRTIDPIENIPFNVCESFITPAAELKPDTQYGNCHLQCPASTLPDIRVEQFNLFKTLP